jgi:ComF family protein
VNSAAATILDDFISLFFPKYCVGCEESLVKGEELICTRCILEMPRSNYHLEPENAFYNKLKGRLPIKYVMSLFKFVKAGRVQHVLHALKYKNKPELGRLLGKIYGDELAKTGYSGQFEMIIPVPLHPQKKKRRGYNQSEEFALGIGESLQIECTEAFLKRLKMTETQTKRTRLKRWENVKEVFEVLSPDKINGRKIMLVDDVVTTGATLEAAGRVLVDAGCSELSIVCIAATQ